MSSQEAHRPAISRILPTIAGALSVAALGVVFSISFVALIYTGPLSSFLGPAIQMTLVGSAIMVVVGAMLHVATEGPEPLIVRRHMPGSMIGEIAFTTGLSRTASVVAETACELAEIDGERLDDLALGRGEFYALVAARMGERLARTTRLLQQLSR